MDAIDNRPVAGRRDGGGARGLIGTDTALRDIRELLERGILVQNQGGGRSTSYRLGEPQGDSA